MATQLAQTLQNFYSRQGNRILFQNKLTLNQLALKMWEKLGYQEIDASVLSRVIAGERLFTPNQLGAFCQILNIKDRSKAELKGALVNDLLARYGLGVSKYLDATKPPKQSPKETNKALKSYETNVLKLGARELLQAASDLPVPEELKEYAVVEGAVPSRKGEKRSRIGIILPKFYPHYEEVVLPILKKELEQRGFGWNVTYSAESPLLFARQFWLFYKKFGFAGVVVLPPPSGTWSRIVEQSVGADYPLVCIDRSLLEKSKFPSVKPTHFEGSRRLTETLIKKRYKKVVLVDGDLQFEAFRKRAQGFKAALEKTKLNSARLLIKEGKEGLWRSAPEKRKVEEFIRGQNSKEGLAFFAVNSARAKLLYHVASRAFGKWPENWAMSHFDGLDESGLKNGQFFAEEQDKETIAGEAVRLLMRKINKLPIREPVDLVPTRFVRS